MDIQFQKSAFNDYQQWAVDDKKTIDLLLIFCHNVI